MKLLVALAIIVIALFLFINLGESQENFELPGHPLRSRFHIKLDCRGNQIYSSLKPPPAHGELGCTQVPCPKGYADDLTCWRCCNYH